MSEPGQSCGWLHPGGPDEDGAALEDTMVLDAGAALDDPVITELLPGPLVPPTLDASELETRDEETGCEVDPVRELEPTEDDGAALDPTDDEADTTLELRNAEEDGDDDDDTITEDAPPLVEPLSPASDVPALPPGHAAAQPVQTNPHNIHARVFNLASWKRCVHSPLLFSLGIPSPSCGSARTSCARGETTW